MIKSISIVLIFLTLTISLAAQDASIKIPIEQDSMENDSKQFLIRWAEATLGFRLSKDESILYSDNSAILIGLNGHPSRLIATHAFSPTLLSSGLQLEFIGLNSVIVDDFGPGTDQTKFHPIPEWLATLSQLEALVLFNVELSNITICENLPLKYLDLRKVHYNDKSSVLRTIGNLKDLKIFVHDESFSTEDLSIIKERLPDVRFASKASSNQTR